MVLEYDVYGKFEFEREDGKKSKPEWGRRWCPVSECALVEDWADNVKTFELQLKAKRIAAEAEFAAAPAGETAAQPAPAADDDGGTVE